MYILLQCTYFQKKKNPETHRKRDSESTHVWIKETEFAPISYILILTIIN